jgi:hypothetical protein
MFPHPTGPHGRHGRAPFRILRTLAAVAVLGLGLLSAAPAADPPAMTDVTLARAALARIDADPQLRDANLIVSVVDRVAVVGGPVPTAAAAKRAEEVVRTVRGIVDVKNHCFVQAGLDPLIRAVADRRPATPRRPFLTDLPAVLPGAQPSTLADPTADPIENGLALGPGEPRVARRLPSPADNVLLGPVGVPAAGPPDAAPFSPVPPAVLTSVPPAPAPVTVPVRPGDPLAAADAVRRADPRFAGLRVEQHNGTLVIAGFAARASDAWDLAQAVRGIPGVTRVAVGSVEVR